MVSKCCIRTPHTVASQLSYQLSSGILVVGRNLALEADRTLRGNKLRHSTVSAMSVVMSSTLAMGALTSRPRFVVWFRSDLRLHDNPVLSKVAAIPGAKEIIPVFCFDPRQVGKNASPPHNTFGSAKSNALRARFLVDSVADLKENLASKGSDLLVGIGKPEELLPLLIQPPCNGPTTFICQEQVTSEELDVDYAVARALKRAKPDNPPQLLKLWSGTLYDDNAIKMLFGADLSSMPDVFTPFRNKVEAKADVAGPLDAPIDGSLPLPSEDAKSAISKTVDGSSTLTFASIPSLSDLGYSDDDAIVAEECSKDPRAVMPFRGGERAALARVKHYLWDADCLGTYFETRNGMLGADYSSKFAPWLAN